MGLGGNELGGKGELHLATLLQGTVWAMSWGTRGGTVWVWLFPYDGKLRAC